MSVYRFLAFIYPIIDRYIMPSKSVLTAQLEGKDSGKLLDIGCGMALIWSQWSKHECWGVDSSKQMIQHGSSKLTQGRCLLADARNVPFQTEEFDIVVIAHMLSTIKEVSPVLLEAHRVLKKGGVCYIQNHDSTKWHFFDVLIRPFAVLFGVKVPFYLHHYIDSSYWTVEMEHKLGRFSYFKLITLHKR